MFDRSRRTFLLGLSAVLLDAQSPEGKGQSFASDARRYVDAATEFQVLRLTSPDYSSFLTAPSNRAISGRNTLFFSNDRTGRMELYRCDLRNGQTRQLTSAEHLDPASVALLSGDRSLCFFDGPSLRLLNLSTLKEHEVYSVPEGYRRGRGFSLTTDGARAFFIEQTDTLQRLRSVALARGQASTVLEAPDELSDPLPRPAHSSLLYRRGPAWNLVNFDGRDNRRLALSPGEATSLSWSAGGASLFYLNVTADRGQLNTIRELNVETPTNTLVAKTTQYISFSGNADSTVFVGASGSQASPHVLILIRSVRRELTLCEHRSRDPRIVSPIFAPSSQRIFFMSDQHGKPAIYTMNVERFVEETESN